MTGGKLPERYAEALFELASEKKVLDQVDGELQDLVGLLAQNKPFSIFLNHPGIEAENKKTALEKVLGGRVSDLTKHFLFLLIDHRRQNCLAAIQELFSELADKERGILRATVTGAAELTDDQIGRLKAKVESTTGKKVRMTAKVDPGLIGGLQLQIGDRVIDGSVATALVRLHRELLKSNFQQGVEVS